MIQLTKPQRGVARVALLLAACLSTSEAVQVATPAQADLQVSEDLGVDGASAFDAVNVNALYDTANLNLKNGIVALRFDLTGRGRLQSSKAWLKLTNAKQHTGGQILNFHGVVNGAKGYNEVTSAQGSFTDNNWPENSTTFSTTPGLRFDADSTTRGVDLDPSMTTFLGSVTVDNGNRDEGAELILSTPELQNFLTSHPDDVVTILVSSNSDGNSQKRFATKEATSLDTILTPVPAGTYAPKLVLDLPGEKVRTSADAQVRELDAGSATPPVFTYNTGNGVGTSLNARWNTAEGAERNFIIALRFDLTNVTPGQITAADLRLVNHRTNTNFNRLHFYGVNDGATGRDATNGQEGTFSDNNWPESGTVFSTMPGLEYDGINTPTSGSGVIPGRVTDLGTTYVSGGNRSSVEGVELVFNTEILKSFLNNHPDRIVTILVITDGGSSNGDKRFASKETTLLDGEVENPENPFPPGTFAPSLNLGIDRFAITNMTLGSGQITLTWDSQPDQAFRITHSENLQDGFPGVSATNIPAAVGASTTHTFTNPLPAAPRLFFRVERTAVIEIPF